MMSSGLSRPGVLAGALLWLLAAASPAPAATTASMLYAFDFRESDQGFTPVDYCALWQRGAPLGAPAALGGEPVWALGEPVDADDDGTRESVAVGYINNCVSSLTSPVLALEGVPDVTLSLVHYVDLRPSTSSCGNETALECGDGGRLRLLAGDGSSRELEPDGGYPVKVDEDGSVFGAFGGLATSDGWVTSYFDLQGLTAAEMRLELRFLSDHTEYEYDGWIVRELMVWEGDIIPPDPSIPDPIEDTSDVVGPYVVRAHVTDNREVAAVSLYYQVDGGLPREVPMTREEADPEFWTGSIPGQISSTDVAYYVVATDSYGNRAVAPEGEPLTFRVRLAPPLDLELVREPVQATTVELQWQEPDEKYKVHAYVVRHQLLDEEGQLLLEEEVEDLDGDAADLFATVRASGYPGYDNYAVRARYEVPRAEGGFDLVDGDYSNTDGLTLIVPYLHAITPSHAFQGSTLEVNVEGVYSTFVKEDLEVSLGEGIRVIDIRVRDVSFCTLTLEIEPEAPTGNHPLEMGWPGVEPGSSIHVTLDPGLEVRSEAERPRIVSVDPARVFQRETKIIKFTGAHTDFMRDPPVVDFLSGISAGPVQVLSATEFEVEIEVGVWAPAGERSITVVSGGLSDEASFKVEVPIETGGGCSCGGDRAADRGFFPLLALLGCAQRLLLNRRRGRAVGLRGDYAEPRMESKNSQRPGPRSPHPHAGVDLRCTGRERAGFVRRLRDLLP